MSLKDWMPDRTFWIAGVSLSAILGWIFDIPWWGFLLWFFLGLALPSLIFGWLFGENDLKGNKKGRDHWRP